MSGGCSQDEWIRRPLLAETICDALTPKFRAPRFPQCLSAVQKLDRLARQRFGKRVIELAIRLMLDQGIATALRGSRRPDQLQPIQEVTGWRLDAPADAEIDRILRQTIVDPVGPEFMDLQLAQETMVNRPNAGWGSAHALCEPKPDAKS